MLTDCHLLQQKLDDLKQRQKNIQSQLNQTFLIINNLDIRFNNLSNKIKVQQNCFFQQIRVELFFLIVQYLDYQSLQTIRFLNKQFNIIFVELLPKLVLEFDSRIVYVEKGLKIYQIQENYTEYQEFWNEYNESKNQIRKIILMQFNELEMLFKQKNPAKVIKQFIHFLSLLIQKNQYLTESEAKTANQQLIVDAANIKMFFNENCLENISNTQLGIIQRAMNINNLDITMASSTAMYLLRNIKSLIQLRSSSNFSNVFGYVLLKKKIEQLGKERLHLNKLMKKYKC